MIARLSPSARKLLAVAVLVLAVAAAASLLYLPFGLVDHERRELARVDARIAEVGARLPLRDQLLGQERVLEQATDLDRVLLRAPTAGVAAAQLQGELSTLAGDMEVGVSSVQILEPAPEPPFTRIGLRLAATAQTGALRDFLHAVETRAPALVIDSFGLVAPETISDSQATPLLTATIELHGWLREEDEPTDAAAASPPS